MDALAAVCERVVSYGSRLRKVALVADYLRTLSDADLVRAVHFLSSGPMLEFKEHTDARTLSIGYATLREAYKNVTGWDDSVIGRCHEEVGDTGETISLLLPGHTENLPLTLEETVRIYTRLYHTRRAAQKIEILSHTFSNYRPLSIKYFVKIITNNLRIGLQSKMVEEAVAAAAGVPHESIRQANNRLGNLAEVALAARHDRVHLIEARLFHPMDFMLAKPLDSVTDLADPEAFLVEHKYDGIRSQAHVAEGRVLLYTRGMD
jgi:DNA ligase-1